MPKEQIVKVVNGHLGLQEDDRFHPHIPVGTSAWYSWLANHEGFAYQDETGRFTARCEQIKGKGAYWYAYRRHGKKVRKKYLGKTARLTPERLRQIAAELAETTGIGAPTTLTSEAVSQPPIATRADVETSFLVTKFSPPKPPVHLVDRSRLTERLNAPIIYVSAPAGSGKSTLINQWLRQAQVPFIWVALDESDDDRVQFWQLVFASIRQVLPQVLPDVGLTTVRTNRTVLTEIINRIQQIENPHCLVLDDFHHIKNKAIQGDVALLLEHLPQQLRVVLTSRTQAPFNVGRWRAKGWYVDLDADDLRFTLDEGVAYLSQMTDLDRHEMLAMVARTEGWVTGLQLVSLAVSHQGNVQKYLALPDKSIAYLTTYLLEDVLEHEPAHIQTFLLQIAILRTLNIDLCNAVTGQDNAATMLAYLDKENLFATAVPGRPGWYRLHQLIAEMLEDQLLNRLPDQVNDLHLRAAQWYEAAGTTEDAVRHLLAAQAWEEAAALIERHAPTIFFRGEVARLSRWLEGLPPPVLQNHPLLMLTYARLSSDSLPEVIRRLGQHSADSYPSSNDAMAMDVSQLPDYLADLGIALTEDENTADSFTTYHHLWQVIDLLLLSSSYRLAGQWQSAEPLLAQVMTLGATYGHDYITLQAAGMLTTQHVRQGHLRQGEQIINQLAQQAQRPVSQLTSSLIIGQSMIYYERNQLDEAYKLLTATLAQVDVQYQSEVSMRIRWLLARVLSALGKNEEAEDMMATIVTERSQKQMSWLSIADLVADQAYMWLLHDKLALAEEWLYKSGLQVDGELTQENSYSQLVHAHILIAQKRHSAAAKLLANLSVSFPAGIHSEPFLKLLLPLAIALFGQGKVNPAVRTLWQGLRLAAGEGYIRPFLEQGADMATLLTLVGQQGQVSQSIKRNIVLLLYEFGQSGIDIPTNTRSDMSALVTAASITAREQEVLQLLAQGLSNQEISQRLIITVNTVKSHLRRTYLKLEVRNRAQAVMRAQELHLL
jgi:LuxR family maltose regulon positive regulatory protein